MVAQGSGGVGEGCGEAAFEAGVDDGEFLILGVEDLVGEFEVREGVAVGEFEVGEGVVLGLGA